MLSIKDYFKIQLRRPTLEGPELAKEEKRVALLAKMDALDSRLESLEILNSNGKIEDFRVLAEAFLFDALNLGHHLEKSSDLPKRDKWWEDFSWASPELQEIFKKNTKAFEYLNSKKLEEEEYDSWETAISDLGTDLRNQIQTISRKELNTAISEYQRRWKVQGTAFFSFVLIFFLGVFIYYTKYPSFRDTNLQVFFLSQKGGSPTEELSTKEIIKSQNKGEWIEYTLSVPQGIKELSGARIDFGDFIKSKYQIKSLQVLDKDGKVLGGKEFVIPEGGFLPEREDYGALNDIKLVGKLEPGKFIQIETIGMDPYLTAFFPTVKNPSSVKVILRFIESHKKFKD